MTLFDILTTLLILALMAYFFYFKKKKKKSEKENTPETENVMSNYNTLRGIQSGNTPLHGVSIVSLYYDSMASYAGMENDGTNTSFDLNCETKVNDVLKSLKADGYTPTLNALACVDRVIFYIIY